MAWRPPSPRVEARAEPATGSREARDSLARIVVTYIVALAVCFGVAVTLMQHGW